MANQPENPVYDAGIYQIEVNDPVQGGEGGLDNKPLLGLANRTAYLKQHVDALEQGTTIPDTVAPRNSPALTGTPTAPTQPLGDRSTKIATAAFVHGVANGRLVKSVAGGATVVLTADEAAYAILDLNGALTASIAVIVPATPGLWVVRNATSGNHTLTVKTPSGTGVAVTQGKAVELWCDGTNVMLSTTDFVSPALTGTPTAPTPVTGNSSLQIATTAFVQAAIAAVVNSSPATLDTLNELAAALGNDPNFATTMTTALAGKAPSSHVGAGGGAHSLATQANHGFMSAGDKQRIDAAIMGSQYDGSFGHAGYMKFPNGFMIQWTQTSGLINPGSHVNGSWPIAFPNICIFGSASVIGTGDSSAFAYVVALGGNPSRTQFTVYNHSGNNYVGGAWVFGFGY